MTDHEAQGVQSSSGEKDAVGSPWLSHRVAILIPVSETFKKSAAG